jgi:hypothetical protein
LNEWDFGRTRKITSVVAKLESKLKSVDGDVQQTTSLLLAYYQKQSYCLQNEVSKLQAQIQSREDEAVSYSADFPQLLKSKIEHPALVSFCQEVDGCYLFQIKQHYNGFHYLNSPLVSVDYRLSIYNKIREYFPGHCDVFDSLAFSEYRLKPCFDDSSRRREIKLAVVTHFLALCHQHNSDLLCHWAMVETLAFMSKGLPKLAMQHSANQRYATSPTYAMNELDRIYETGQPTVNAAILAQSYLGVGLDNYQRVHQKSYQNNGQSSITHRGTVSFLRCMMMPSLPLGTILKSPWGDSYSVYESSKLNPYRSFLKMHRRIDLCPNNAVPSALQIKVVWPTVGWQVQNVPGWDEAIEMSYVSQKIVRAPQLMIPSAFKLDNCLFKTIVPVYASDFKPLSVEDYWNLGCRSQLLGEFLAFKGQCEKDKPFMQIVDLIGSGTAEC